MTAHPIPLSSAPATIPVDLVGGSIKGLLAIAFPRSRAKLYPVAVELAKSGMQYSESTIGNVGYHLAVFGTDYEQAARALAIVRALRGQKGAEFYVRGIQVYEIRSVERVIACYIDASACKDWRAHCHRIINHPFQGTGSGDRISQYDGAAVVSWPPNDEPPKMRYIWPCTFMLSWGAVKLQPDHPSSIQDQIQARAVEIGCSFCPHFHPSLSRV